MKKQLAMALLLAAGCLPPGQTPVPDKADFAFVQIHLHG
jgi:hypothetical protein